MKRIFNPLMLWGAALGGLIFYTVTNMMRVSAHRGPGTMIYGDGDRYPEVEVVEPESEYKHHRNTQNSALLLIIFGTWYYVAKISSRETAEAKAREKYLEAQLRRANAYQHAFASAVDAATRDRAAAEAQSSREFKDAQVEETRAQDIHNDASRVARGDT